MTRTKTDFPHQIRVIEHAAIRLSDGVTLSAMIWLPVDAEKNPVPAILEYLPYRKRDGTVERDALTHPYFAGHGYACVRVDMRGSGDSDGVLKGEYLKQEQDDALKVLKWRTLGIALLIITHNLNVVRHVADRLAVMYLGRIVEEGPTEAVFANPRHRYTAALLSANPKPDPDAVHSRLEIDGEVPSLFERPSGCEFHPRCPFAVDVCRIERPPFTLASPSHRFACHNPG